MQGSSTIYAKYGYRHFNVTMDIILQIVGLDTLTLDADHDSWDTTTTLGGISMTDGQAAFYGVTFQNLFFDGNGGALSLGPSVSMVTIDG